MTYEAIRAADFHPAVRRDDAEAAPQREFGVELEQYARDDQETAEGDGYERGVTRRDDQHRGERAAEPQCPIERAERDIVGGPAEQDEEDHAALGEQQQPVLVMPRNRRWDEPRRQRRQQQNDDDFFQKVPMDDAYRRLRLAARNAHDAISPLDQGDRITPGWLPTG